MPDPWKFVHHFKAGVYSWRSSAKVISRIKAAVAEIRKVAKTDPVRAADGAVKFIERIVPAIEQVDSSSGALGSAVYDAIEAMADVVARAPLDVPARTRLLDRLMEAFMQDGFGYLDSLGERWGTLCATPEVASYWASELIGTFRHVKSIRARGGFDLYRGSTPCLSALLAAGRLDETIELGGSDPRPHWSEAQFAAKALEQQGRFDEAIALAEACSQFTGMRIDTAAWCEGLLIRMGRHDEAFSRYALLAHRRTTYLATFRSIRERYPGIDEAELLAILVERSPGEEGKWFAAARSAGLRDAALALCAVHPVDPKTLIRAAKADSAQYPVFATHCAVAALEWIHRGYGYEIEPSDVAGAFEIAIALGASTGRLGDVRRRVEPLTTGEGYNAGLLRRLMAQVAWE